ncbi:hypothetical protein BGZ61DRAFT_500672 [Ilyonectria robusta]|uniref:uncharacterized protein n=1 Tax=Ilyonectria robusta TaxID=1079257 RepID=UPI001E8D4EB4|nr:uncharacterized protein BGZ61DRAFT_500672 [Ilyonectria robusta]KAH8654189.1 hypothetical protein BGZ61DRAFT_500672 [Ilyonectria robusta]
MSTHTWFTIITLLSPQFVLQERRGLLVFHSTYIWIIWLEILIYLIFSIISYRLKVGIAVLIIAINISVYNIWIPTYLQISERALNFYFICIIQQNLVANSLTKYKSLVKFNIYIIRLSLSIDILIISIISLNNIYIQFHPFTYIIKLKIEISIADLIGKITRQGQYDVISNGTFGDLETAQQGNGPSKNLTSTYSRTRVSTDGIHTIRGVDAVSIELQERPDKSAAFNSRSKTNRDTKFLGQSSSSSLQVGVAIYTTEGNRIDVNTTITNHGESIYSVADSFDENGSARKDDNDERPLSAGEGLGKAVLRVRGAVV